MQFRLDSPARLAHPFSKNTALDHLRRRQLRNDHPRPVIQNQIEVIVVAHDDLRYRRLDAPNSCLERRYSHFLIPRARVVIRQISRPRNLHQIAASSRRRQRFDILRPSIESEPYRDARRQRVFRLVLLGMPNQRPDDPQCHASRKRDSDNYQRVMVCGNRAGQNSSAQLHIRCRHNPRTVRRAFAAAPRHRSPKTDALDGSRFIYFNRLVSRFEIIQRAAGGFYFFLN